MSEKKKFGAANDKPKVFSLRDLQGNDSCSSDEDGKQTYYAGGEKSGVAISGGGGKKDMKAAQDIMSGIFSKASSEDPSKAKKPSSFGGAGKKLSGSPTSTSSKASARHAVDEPAIVTVDLIFWNDGFTIAQGPLQSYTEPEGLRLLERIKNGTVTADDLGIGPFEMADVRISQLPSEAFSPNRRNQVMKGPGGASSSATEQSRPTFTGTGEKLGATDDTNDVVIKIDESAQLDASITTTRIQIILPNGSRKVLTISPRSQVSELYLQVAKETGLSNFKLKVGNPAKLILESLDAQLYQIGLLNASIIISPVNN